MLLKFKPIRFTCILSQQWKTVDKQQTPLINVKCKYVLCSEAAQQLFQETFPPHEITFTIPKQKPYQMAGPFIRVSQNSNAVSQGSVRLSVLSNTASSLFHHLSKHCILPLLHPTNFAECRLFVWHCQGLESLVNRTNKQSLSSWSIWDTIPRS